MRAKELAKILDAAPGDPEVIIEIFDENDKLVGDSSFTIDEINVGPFVILRSTDAPVTTKEQM